MAATVRPAKPGAAAAAAGQRGILEDIARIAEEKGMRELAHTLRREFREIQVVGDAPTAEKAVELVLLNPTAVEALLRARDEAVHMSPPPGWAKQMTFTHRDAGGEYRVEAQLIPPGPEDEGVGAALILSVDGAPVVHAMLYMYREVAAMYFDRDVFEGAGASMANTVVADPARVTMEEFATLAYRRTVKVRLPGGRVVDGDVLANFPFHLPGPGEFVMEAGRHSLEGVGENADGAPRGRVGIAILRAKIT